MERPQAWAALLLSPLGEECFLTHCAQALRPVFGTKAEPHLSWLIELVHGVSRVQTLENENDNGGGEN